MWDQSHQSHASPASGFRCQERRHATHVNQLTPHRTTLRELSLPFAPPVSCLQKSAHRGVFVLTMHYLLYLWRYRIRRQNPVLSVFWPVPDDLLAITRPQRIACMCLELMVS